MGDSGAGGWQAFHDEGSAPSAKPASKGMGTRLIAAVVMLGSVSVIGILAAIAIPNFLAMQMRSKRAEAPQQVEESQWSASRDNPATMDSANNVY
jgi:hypothetical protein